MKRLNQALIVASSLVAPFAAHATDVAPLTRAQVRSQLIAAEQNGTYPTSKVHYPDAQPDAATVFVANRAASKSAADSTYGGSANGSFASGSHSATGWNDRPQPGNLYSHH